jgi:hypothetical protein
MSWGTAIAIVVMLAILLVASEIDYRRNVR